MKQPKMMINKANETYHSKTKQNKAKQSENKVKQKNKNKKTGEQRVGQYLINEADMCEDGLRFLLLQLFHIHSFISTNTPKLAVSLLYFAIQP
jgi:hypothetical protein